MNTEAKQIRVNVIMPNGRSEVATMSVSKWETAQGKNARLGQGLTKEGFVNVTFLGDSEPTLVHSSRVFRIGYKA